MTGPAYQIDTTPTEHRVWCWIRSRENMDAIGAKIGRRVTRKDFASMPLVVKR